MPSRASDNLSVRLKDVEQLFAAHTALTKFKKAHAVAAGGLAGVAAVVDALVKDPGKGRPAEVGALNRAAFVLLTAHFQGFVEDLHREGAAFVLKGKVSSVDDIVKLVTPRNANPHADVIDRMFSGIGCYELMSKIHWQKCSNATAKKRLTTFIETRNKISHGKEVSVTKAQVISYKKFVEILADKLDEAVRAKVSTIIGKHPW